MTGGYSVYVFAFQFVGAPAVLIKNQIFFIRDAFLSFSVLLWIFSLPQNTAHTGNKSKYFYSFAQITH